MKLSAPEKALISSKIADAVKGENVSALQEMSVVEIADLISGDDRVTVELKPETEDDDHATMIFSVNIPGHEEPINVELATKEVTHHFARLLVGAVI